MWVLWIAAAAAEPGLQATVGVDLGINLRRGAFPLTAGLQLSIDGFTGRRALAGLGGVWARGQVGARPVCAFAAGGRIGVGYPNYGDGLGVNEAATFVGEVGLGWTGGPPVDRDGPPSEPAGVETARWAQRPALYAGASATIAQFGQLRAGAYLDDGAELRMGSVGLGLGLPLVPVMMVGRPLRVGSGWLSPWVGSRAESCTSSEEARRATEEASAVGAFVRLAAELHALGAPRPLVGRALRAAVEEVEHTAGALARSGASMGPIPLLPARSGDRVTRLSRLVEEGLLDGIVGEGAAALEAEARATGPDWAFQAKIAADERGHAELGGDVAVWAAAESGRAGRAWMREVERRV